VIRAFVLVTIRSFRNRVWSAIKRLRDPRYLIAFLLAAAYFASVFARVLFATSGREGHAATALAGDVAGLVVLVLMVLAWAAPEESGGLTFSEAEIQFLFPAPITRRQLLLYKVLRAQPQVFISAAMISFLMFRGAKFIGVWACFITLSIYFTFVALGRARLKLLGVGFLVRLPVIAAAAAGIAYLLWRTVDLGAFRGLGARLRPGRLPPDLPALVHGPVADAILFVPRFFGWGALIRFGSCTTAAFIPLRMVQPGNCAGQSAL
jgi:hypothetical protein